MISKKLGFIIIETKQSLRGIKIKLLKTASASSVLFMALIIFSFKYNQPEVILYDLAELDNAQATLLHKTTELNDETLLNEIREQGILNAYHVLAQAQLESYYYKSKIFKNTFNLFGMRYPGKRNTTAVGLYLSKHKKVIKGDKKTLKSHLKFSTFSVYECWQDAVMDYKLWQDATYNGTDNYAKFLKGIYASAPQYAEHVEKMAKDLAAKYPEVNGEMIVEN